MNYFYIFSSYSGILFSKIAGCKVYLAGLKLPLITGMMSGGNYRWENFRHETLDLNKHLNLNLEKIIFADAWPFSFLPGHKKYPFLLFRQVQQGLQTIQWLHQICIIVPALLP